MDEMRMVRRLVNEPPPAPQVVAEGRARLFGSSARGERTTWTIRRAVFRSAFGLGLTGAAAAMALTVATLVPGASRAPMDEGPATTDGSARNVLLAVAARAETAPTNGTYWHVRRMFDATWPRKLGRGDNRYTVEHLSINEEWTKRSGKSWWGRREWVRPKTSEDAEAWRRDDSPSKWCMGYTDTEPPEPNCLHTAPGTAFLTRDYHAFEVVEGRELTFQQLQRLPEDSDGLRAWVVDAVKEDLDPSAPADIVDVNVAENLVGLLVDVPVPPGVRAAAYRALADMPNVESTGPTQDELGRDGVGISIDTGDTAGIAVLGGHPIRDSGELTLELIIDPDTSYVLYRQTSFGEKPDLNAGTLILEVGWTDEEPQEPPLP
jgi:hypothetical protein